MSTPRLTLVDSSRGLLDPQMVKNLLLQYPQFVQPRSLHPGREPRRYPEFHSRAFAINRTKNTRHTVSIFFGSKASFATKTLGMSEKKSMGRHRPWTQTWHCYELIGWKSGSPSRVPEKVWPLKRDIQMLRKFSLKEASWIMLLHLLYISLEHIL